MRFQIAKSLIVCVALAGVGCTGMSKLDYGSVLSRAGWQKPDAVMDALGVAPGQQVADVGAGDGYFSFLLAERVGDTGRVYAVEVDDEKVAALGPEAVERGAANVEAVRGDFTDPKLPDGRIDLVLLVNTYHHIEKRSTYFADLIRDLAPSGRVAIIDMRDDLTGILRLFATKGHWTNVDELSAEMTEAGYVRVDSFDFLPVQSFEVWAPANEHARLDSR